jgi:hypothetical protein
MKKPTWVSKRLPHGYGIPPQWSQSGHFRIRKNATEHSSSPLRDTIYDSSNDSYEDIPVSSQPYDFVRVRKRHKVRERIHSPYYNNHGGPGSGPIVSKRNIKSSDVSGRITADFEKLFRSKSQESRRLLEFLQLALLGHVIKTETYLRETAKFLCVRSGFVRVYKKPSFKAVRCLLSMIKDCEATSFQIEDSVRKFSSVRPPTGTFV